MIVFDEAKRQTNLAKHGLDLADAGLVYARSRVTFSMYFLSNGGK